MAQSDVGEQPSVCLVVDRELRVFDVVVRSLGGVRIDSLEWMGREVLDLFEAEDRPRVQAALQDADGGMMGDLSLRWRFDGELRDVLVRVCPGERFNHVLIEPPPEAAAPAGVEELDAAPAKPVEAESSRRLEYIGMVASRVSHDFKNLLAAILVNAEFLSREGHDAELVSEVSEEIVVATERARELVDQILQHSGTEGDGDAVVDINQLTHEMGRLLDVSTPPTVVMRFDLEDDLPVVMGQPARLRQLIMNFIVNAAEAIGDEVGAIMVGTHALEADHALLSQTRTRIVPAPGTYLCITIEDSGPGLDDQTVRQIFDPFFSTKSSGHGLGLSASLEIVEEHGGALLVDTVPGQGATFRVLLPPARVAAKVEPESPSVRASRDFQGHILLIIDDDDLLRSVTRRALQARGAEVLVARDGLEGIDVFDDEHARLSCVLLDMGMPYIKGTDVYDELRRIDPKVPVIFVSGHDQGELSSYPEVRNADGLLLKPFRDTDLVDALVGVLER
ncbi:MAG: ATP-binding protein [Myxococcota bacterium]